MNPEVESSVATPVLTGRVRVLLLATLAAFVWLLLSVFGSGGSATASEEPDRVSLLDAVIGTVDEVSPVPSVTDPVNAVVDEVTAPLDSVVAPVVQHAVPEPITAAATSTLDATVSIVNEVVEPVTDQPVVAETLELVDELVRGTSDIVALPPIDMQQANTLTGQAPGAITDPQPTSEPTSEPTTPPASITDGVHAPGDSIRHLPADPGAPATPASAPSSTLAHGSAPLTLLAALTGVGHTTTSTGASAGWTDFATPPSPTYDNDTSPG